MGRFWRVRRSEERYYCSEITKALVETISKRTDIYQRQAIVDARHTKETCFWKLHMPSAPI